jgi:hypothetical protein
MAKLTCSKSSIVFQCEYIPQTFSDKTFTHPFFNIPQKTLISLYGKWSIGKFTAPESYLYYLALLESTELIEWRAPAQFTTKTTSLVSGNIPNLIDAITKTNSVNHPNFNQPYFVISPDTNDLENSTHWIEVWRHNYEDWVNSKHQENVREHIKARRERSEIKLQRLIKGNVAKESTVATQLANWADTAGYFPEFIITHPISHKKIKCNEYWKEIIRACVNEESIGRYSEKDIEEVYDHCLENVPMGNIFSSRLFKVLRGGLEKNNNYFGLGDFDVGNKKTSYKILSDTDSAFEANISAAIIAAPMNEPKRETYTNSFEYLKAKMKWELAVKRAEQFKPNPDNNSNGLGL